MDQKTNRDHPDHSIDTSARILEDFWRFDETCCHFDFCEKSLAKNCVKNNNRILILKNVLNISKFVLLFSKMKMVTHLIWNNLIIDVSVN